MFLIIVYIEWECAFYLYYLPQQNCCKRHWFSNITNNDRNDNTYFPLRFFLSFLFFAFIFSCSSVFIFSITDIQHPLNVNHAFQLIVMSSKTQIQFIYYTLHRTTTTKLFMNISNNPKNLCSSFTVH